jgi:hypothetical protein
VQDRRNALLAIEICVSQAENGSWIVTQRQPHRALKGFRQRGHALAFARAVAFSRHAPLFVQALDGTRTQQRASSLTYPVCLD